MRKLIFTLRDAVTAIAFVILAALIVAKLDEGSTERLSGPFRATDGDTLSRDGKRYRLEGIDAPERTQTCGGADAVWRCGEAAQAALRELVSAGGVECTGRSRDRYGRLLVVCRSGGRDLNGEMVRQGMAIAYGRPEVDYRREEQEARAARRGVWSGDFDRPQDWRRMNGSVADGGFDWLRSAVGRLFGFDTGHEWED
ncbi:thermonuclease family protein [Rhizobiaceae bacterium BDR2-2]|uniref:Thermonuclease family protein n=1 Tax=Ectorhizobium quercum TaxID=2965071 RepID=A0AAE3N420_9HYPH|nr:thermonuclease family protein [Ectorhizobium quercum]MCX8999816.1 thermonuclease family protein [Ectorhizobium quercum]